MINKICMGQKSSCRWEHFAHPSDVGIRGIGPNVNQAFEQVALALMAIITDPSRISCRDAIELHVEAPSSDLLLVDWLNQLIYEVSTRRMLFGRFEVVIENSKLRARAWGEPLKRRKHRPTVEVKAATYHQASVWQNKDGEWVAQCVVDV